MSEQKRPGPTIGNMIAGILAFGAAVGGYFFVRGQVRNSRASKMEKLSADETNPAFFAKRFRMAFINDNWFNAGTDEELVRKTMQAIPSLHFFNAVQDAYKAIYKGRNLMEDLQNELTTTEFSEIMAILNAKPRNPNGVTNEHVKYTQWAKRLKAAFDIKYGGIFPGTDEDAIKAVFSELPTQKAFTDLSTVYQREYGNNLLNELKSELEFWEYKPMMDIIAKKPKG
jgi:hypothetical protein